MNQGRCSHASHSLQVILISQSNESDISCTISCLQLSKIDLFLLIRVAILARDSIIYFIVIFGPCASIKGLLVLTLTICYFLACLTFNIVSITDKAIVISVIT